jgi:hypothetical protein
LRPLGNLNLSKPNVPRLTGLQKPGVFLPSHPSTKKPDSALWAQRIAVETIAKIPSSTPAQKQKAYLTFAQSCLNAKLWLPAWYYAMRAESNGLEKRSFLIDAVMHLYLYRFWGQ